MPYPSPDEDPRRRRILDLIAASIQRPPIDPGFTANGQREAALEGGRNLLRSQGYLPDEPQKQVVPALNRPPVVNLPPPNPNTPDAPVQPEAINSVPLQQPKVRIGYSTAGLTGVDKLLERRKAYEEADPESNVKISSDYAEIEPPQHRKGFLGRLKSLGEGALTGLAMSDPDRPLQGLGAAIGGGTLGAASPRGEAKLQRRFQLDQLNNDIARGLQLEQMQTGVGRRGPLGTMSTRVVGEGEYDGIDAGTEIRVRVNPRTGEVTDVVGPDKKPVVSKSAKTTPAGAPHYDSDNEGYLISVQGGVATRVKDPSGNEVKVKTKNANGEVVEVEVGGRRLKVTPGQALNYYGAIGGREDRQSETQQKREEDRQSKYDTAQSEFEQLTADETAAGEEKNRAYAYLEQLKGDAIRDSKQYDPAMIADIREATRAAETANSLYRSFGPKKASAKSKMTGNAPTAPRGKTATHGFSVSAWLRSHPSKVEADAKADHDANYKDYAIVP